MLRNIQLRLILSRKGSNSLFQTLVVTLSHLAEALMTKKWCRAPSAGLKPLKHAKNKKGAHSGYFWWEHPLFWTWRLRFWNWVSYFSGGRHIRKNPKTYPKSNFGWYGPPTTIDTGRPSSRYYDIVSWYRRAAWIRYEQNPRCYRPPDWTTMPGHHQDDAWIFITWRGPLRVLVWNRWNQR